MDKNCKNNTQNKGGQNTNQDQSQNKGQNCSK